MQEILWQKGLLGEYSPQVLVNMSVYLMGLRFAVRSDDHRRLSHYPSQIQLVEPPNSTAINNNKPGRTEVHSKGSCALG